MQGTINPSVVRIFADTEGIHPRIAVGAGFIVSPRHIMTAAHVVNCALGLAKGSQDKPEAMIQFDCPLLKDRTILTAKVVRWLPVNDQAQMGEAEDIAVLELIPTDTFPAESKPAPLYEPDSFLNREVLMYGFPQGAENGTNTLGYLLSSVANGKVQLEHRPGYREVAPGFSGTAAWDTQQNAVVGMLVYIDWLKGVSASYMIPVSLLKKAWPDFYEKNSTTSLSLRDMRELGYLQEIARIYNTRSKADDLLMQVDYPAEYIPSFEEPMIFWGKVFQGVEDGLTSFGFEDFLKVIAGRYKNNILFKKYSR